MCLLQRIVSTDLLHVRFGKVDFGNEINMIHAIKFYATWMLSFAGMDEQVYDVVVIKT